jgi:hypothetical protein
MSSCVLHNIQVGKTSHLYAALQSGLESRRRLPSFVPSGLCHSRPFTQGVRPGLRSYAAWRRCAVDGVMLSVVVFVLSALIPILCFADCLPVTEARNHIGETQCITGKVFRVKQGSHGVTFFDFCEDFRVCPFTVVIFPGHLKDIGDVRQLADKVIEVHGPLKAYDGRAEIVVDQLRQLGGEGARIPKLPKDYDVERKGKYSAGSFSLPKAAHAASKKRQPATLPIEIPSATGPVEEANPPQ